MRCEHNPGPAPVHVIAAGPPAGPSSRLGPMEQVDNPSSDTGFLVSEDVATARIERWVAQDRSVILERKLAEMAEDLAERDLRLRRLTDELLLERDRRLAADASVQSLIAEAAAVRTTLWWRLGRMPRWVRGHIRL